MDDVKSAYAYEKILSSLENQLFKEKNIPKLVDQLHIQKSTVSVSGLKDSDYPTVSEYLGGNIRVTKTSTIPIELQEKTKEMKQNCLMGAFQDIDRIWLSVDSDLFIWNYENGSDLAYYDGCCDTILAVSLIKPKANVFDSCIQYLLCIAGQIEILVLGVSISGYKNNILELIPEPIFRIATDNENITVIEDINGRIILGTKSGNILEISYWSEKQSWFKFSQSSVYNTFKYARDNNYKLCAKLLNHSTWKISLLLPNIIANGLMLNESIVQIAPDYSRNMFYTRSEYSLIAQYELLSNDGLHRLSYITEDNIVSKVSRNVKSVERNQFKNIVELCPLKSGYGPLHLMAVTQNGVRLYFTDYLQLSHIRMPPVSSTGICGKMSNVRLCCESRGSVLMVCGTSIDNQALYTISPDAFLLPELVETMSMSWVHGSSWFLMPLEKKENRKYASFPIIQTQHLDAVRRFLIVSVDSIVQLELPSPIHNLRDILEKNSSPQCASIKTWINHFGLEETIYSSLVIASDKQNTFLSTRATEVVLYYLNETIKLRDNSMIIQSSNNLYDLNNPLHQALCMYAARILMPMWDSALVNSCRITSGKDLYVVSSHDCDELAWFLLHLNHLSDFIRENYPRFKSIDLMRFSVASHYGSRSLALELFELLKTSIEIIGLWRILTEHDFHQIVKLMSQEMQNELLRSPVKQLLLPNKRPVLVALISALLQHYLADGASTNSIIDALLQTCPNIYRIEDALCSRANEILVKIDNLSCNTTMDQEYLMQEKEQLLMQAVLLYEQVGPAIDLGSIICRLRAVDCTWGAVHLCLHAAKIRDPQDFAVNCLMEGHRPQSMVEVSAIEGRNDAYKYLLESLSYLFGLIKCSDVLDASPLFPNNNARNSALSDLKVVLNTIFEKKDDTMAHFEAYSWMIENEFTNEILKYSTAHLESYLQHRLQAEPQSLSARNLLWKYYELQGRLLEAAKVLENLAIGDCVNYGLDERLECISRAIVFVRAVIGSNDVVEIDYLKQLEDKVEILHLQKTIIEEIGNDHQLAMLSLNSRLFTVYQLLTEYAEPYDLTMSKLAILRISGHTDSTNIRMIWEELIAKEIDKLNPLLSSETKQVSLKQTIMQVAAKFKGTPNFLPLDLILYHLEAYSDTYGFQTDWTVSLFLAIEIPIMHILQAYAEVIRMKDQEVKKHLPRIYNSICVALDLFLHAHFNPRDKQVYSSQFLDIVATCLIQLQSKLDPASEVLVDRFRSYKALLEQNI